MHYKDLCSFCGKCADVCPNDCIRIEGERRIYDKTNCIACGVCVESCPHSAIRLAGKHVAVEDVVSIVKQDYLFYLNSGGGVTIGGGEPTMQPEFLHALLARLKEIGIHTAIETCGYTDWGVFEKVLPCLDLLFFDVKHIDPVKHQKFTGKMNTPILQNLSKLLTKDVSVVIRIPLIPGFNNDPDTINGICTFLAKHDTQGSVKRVELLPYHKLGVNKYKALNRVYGLEMIETPLAADSEKLEKVVQSFGFDSRIEYI